MRDRRTIGNRFLKTRRRFLMKSLFASLLVFATFALFAFAGDDTSKQSSGRTPASPIPSTFWGIHVHNLTSFPLQVPYGQFRGWDGSAANWPEIAATCNPSSPPTDPSFSWTNFDTQLTNVKEAGVDDVFYTLSPTPPWTVTPGQQG